MARRQHPFGVDGEHNWRTQPLDQRAGRYWRAGRAAAEHHEGILRAVEEGGCSRDCARVGTRAAAGAVRRAREAIGRCGDHVERQLDVHRAGAGAVEDREGAGHDRGQVGGAQQAVAEDRDPAHQAALVGQLVQPALAHAEFVGDVDAGDDEHRNRVGIGLAHGGDDVGHAGAGDDEAGRRAAGGAGVAVGHEARALLVARGDVADAGVGQAAVELDRVHAGDAEDGVDAVALQDLDQHLAAGPHRSPLMLLVGARRSRRSPRRIGCPPDAPRRRRAPAGSPCSPRRLGQRSSR
jgi:hypothetical protein